MPALIGSRRVSGRIIQCAATRAFLARVTGLDSRHFDAYVKTINGLDSYGVFSKFDALWFPASQSQSLGNVNLVSSSFTLIENPTPGSSPAFVADNGYIGVAGSSTVYLDTQYNPSTAGLNYTQDSAHISLFSLTNSAQNSRVAMGLRTNAGTVSQIALRNSASNLAFFNINDNVTNSAGIAVSASNGHYVATRSGSSTQNGYIDGVDKGVVAVASSALTNGNFSILGRTLAPATHEGIGDDRRIAAASIGGALTAADTANFNTWARFFLASVGAI